jgi:hypothetical protein
MIDGVELVGDVRTTRDIDHPRLRAEVETVLRAIVREGEIRQGQSARLTVAATAAGARRKLDEL